MASRFGAMPATQARPHDSFRAWKGEDQNFPEIFIAPTTHTVTGACGYFGRAEHLPPDHVRHGAFHHATVTPSRE